jgi:hypothetical protein
LDKPTPSTVAECISTLKNATSYTSPSEFRKKYIEYLLRDWNSNRYTSYYFYALSEAEKMRKINEEYWNIREVSYSDVTFEEDNVLYFSNQPVSTKIVFSKVSLKNVRWTPK